MTFNADEYEQLCQLPVRIGYQPVVICYPVSFASSGGDILSAQQVFFAVWFVFFILITADASAGL
jgi:hypothetical protein